MVDCQGEAMFFPKIFGLEVKIFLIPFNFSGAFHFGNGVSL
jgi:hypothetical protein